MSKRVAIVQSNYIPWKGYFDLISTVDEFILFDEVQYTRRDWRNRNRIKTSQGLQWLTIPVAVKNRYRTSIREMTVSDPAWNLRHWQTLSRTYARARCFREMAPIVEACYRACSHERLSDINRHFLSAVTPLLEITTPLTWSWQYPPVALQEHEALSAEDHNWTRSRRLASICAQAGAAVYVSGPSARLYLLSQPFTDLGVEVAYFNYNGYPEYDQLHPPFDHYVSIVDLLFNTGRDSGRFLLHGGS